jgi:hypothetical protein
VPSRKHTLSQHEPPTRQSVPRVIDPHAVILSEEFRELFGLSRSTLRREIRHGRLRISKRAGRYFLLGEWILEWIRDGEIMKRGPPSSANGPSNSFTERN